MKLSHFGTECLARKVIGTALRLREPLIGMGHSVAGFDACVWGNAFEGCVLITSTRVGYVYLRAHRCGHHPQSQLQGVCICHLLSRGAFEPLAINQSDFPVTGYHLCRWLHHAVILHAPKAEYYRALNVYLCSSNLMQRS